MRRLGGVLGWVVLVLIGVWLVWDRESQRSGDGQVWLAYVIDTDTTLPLSVSGGRPVRLQLWVESPEPWAPDPRATDPVQLSWRAFDLAGTELAGGTPFTQTRSGWALPGDLDEPLVPVALGPRADHVLSDPRTFVFYPPEGTSRVEVTALVLPEDSRGLIVAFEEDERDTVDQMRAVVGANAEQSARTAERMGPWEWQEVPLDWRERNARTVWRRLASSSQDARPVRLTSSSVWLDHDNASALGFAVPMGGAAAYNLEGEQVFEARWTEPDGRKPRLTRTWLEIMGEGLGEVRDLGRVESVGPLTFEPGVREVRIARDPHDVDGPVLLRATTTGPARDRAWGDPPRAEFPLGVGAEATQRVAPDLTGLIYWRVRADEPLVFDLPDNHEVRVLARPRLEAGRLPGLGPSEPEPGVEVSLTRDGTTTWTKTLPVPGLASAFERYTQGDDPSTARVSEVTEWFLAASDEPSTLTIGSASVVDLQVFIKEHSAPSDVPEPGYPTDLLGEVLRARYLPYARRTWRAQYPIDVDPLAGEGRAIRIDAQVRWVYRGAASGSGLQYRVLELPPPFDLVGEARTGGSRTRLTRKPARIEIPPTGRMLVDYKVSPDKVGSSVKLHFEGRTETFELLTAAGTLRVERLPPGPLRASVTGTGVFLANALGDRPWAVRRMWRLDPGRPRVISIPAGGEGLSVHVARRKTEGHGSILWRMRGQGVDEVPVSDRRREGRWALSTNTGTAEVLSRVEATWIWTEPLRIRVGDRLSGEAALELSLEDRGDPVWVWVSSTWSPPTERLDERHWAIPGVGGN